MKNVYAVATAEYFRYIDSMRSIPIFEDCLKPVEKRILWAVYKGTNKTKLQHFSKSTKVIGDTNVYHPHGDLSIYDTVARMVRLGILFDKQGSFGSPGLKATEHDKGGARYTELKLKPEIYEQMVEIEKYMLMAKIESDEMEPLFIPAIIPFGLIGSDVIMGIGLTTTSFPRYKREDLLARLRVLLGIDKNKCIIKPNISNASLIGEEKDFEQLLTTGKASFRVNVDIKLVNNNKILKINGRHPTLKTSKIENYIANYAKNNEGEVPFTIEDMCEITDSGENRVEYIVRNVNRSQQISQETLDLVKSLFNTKITFTCNVTKFDSHATRNDSEELLFTNPQVGIDEILLESFKEWGEILNRKFQAQLEEKKKQYRAAEVLIYVRSILERKSDIRDTNAVIAFAKTDKQNIGKITESEIDNTCRNNSIYKLLNSKKTKDNDILVNIQHEIDSIVNILNDYDTYCKNRVINSHITSLAI